MGTAATIEQRTAERAPTLDGAAALRDLQLGSRSQSMDGRGKMPGAPIAPVRRRNVSGEVCE
jgi:hypothetical protein